MNIREKELFKAFEENRVIVLPCPIGSTFYRVIKKRGKVNGRFFRFVKKSKLTYHNMETFLRDYGHTVFLNKIIAERTKKTLEHIDSAKIKGICDELRRQIKGKEPGNIECNAIIDYDGYVIPHNRFEKDDLRYQYDYFRFIEVVEISHLEDNNIFYSYGLRLVSSPDEYDYNNEVSDLSPCFDIDKESLLNEDGAMETIVAKLLAFNETIPMIGPRYRVEETSDAYEDPFAIFDRIVCDYVEVDGIVQLFDDEKEAKKYIKEVLADDI